MESYKSDFPKYQIICRNTGGGTHLPTLVQDGNSCHNLTLPFLRPYVCVYGEVKAESMKCAIKYTSSNIHACHP